MNENYHYFVVKTLACRAGFDDGEAQFIAAFSQQIDDFVFEHPVFLTQAPPQFFIDNGYAKKLDNNSWIFFPHSTGISTLLSVWSEFQKNTLVPFHFIPIKPLSEIDKSTNVNRDDYRCVIGSDKKAQMINNLAAQAVENVKTLKNNKSLMRLGMILHTYADTYSHCHYSGLHGWENNSFIFNVDNLIEPKNPVPVFDRIFYWLAPSIGHANTGHTPDICSYTIDLKMKNNINDAFSFDNNRSNSGSFGICSYNIFKFLCQANSQSEDFIKDTWSKLEKELLKAEPVADETDTEALTMHWKSYFSDIDYRYDKSQCFNLDIKIEGFNAVIAERVGISQKEAQDLYNEKGKVVRSNYKTIINNHLKDDDNFFIYNQLAYERAETVTGAKPAPLSNSQSYIMTLNSDKTDWQPSTKLAFAVVLAGFYYDPKQDIIYSTLNNLQRSLGYCSLYDKNAYLMSSIIECEPIYFSYNGFEWMIELWKGQYGLETGCEVGLYKRPQDQPISLIEQLVTGKIYSCVGDKDLITMSFALIKDGNAILQRGPQQHWWLTGFKWGEFSKPEELKVKYTLGFNDDAMPKAFIEGLKKLHYSYEINGNSASFVFDRPFSAQPLISDKIKNICQKDNQKICDAYNNLKKEFKIKTNDPNEIDERLIKNASVENKAIHEHIIAHFKNKQSFVEDILKHSLSGLPIDSVNAKTLRLNSER